jgi:hypothetical protein
MLSLSGRWWVVKCVWSFSAATAVEHVSQKRDDSAAQHQCNSQDGKPTYLDNLGMYFDFLQRGPYLVQGLFDGIFGVVHMASRDWR